MTTTLDAHKPIDLVIASAGTGKTDSSGQRDSEND